MYKEKEISNKFKYIGSITVKEDGKALDIIFVLCLICIIALSVYLYRSSTHFYERLEETTKNNMNMNLQIMQNEHQERIDDLLNQFEYNYRERMVEP